VRLAAALLAASCVPASAQPGLTPLDEAVYTKALASNKGKVVLMDLWATWCAPCLEELPGLIKLDAKYRSRGFQLITISCDEPGDQAQAMRVLRENGAPMPAYLKQVKNDENFINWLDKKWSGALPALFLYDRAGRMVKSFVGETDLAELEKAIQKLL
jgi:thiol-disulfide isomerase/thioredoxin